MYTGFVSADRRYQLQSEEANRRLDALLEHLRVPEFTWPLYAEMLTTALKMYEDGAGIADLKIANAAFKEIRYGFKVFAPWRNVPKVTMFGSARTPRSSPISEQAFAFSKRITGAGWMVMTGAGAGGSGSAQGGGGAEGMRGGGSRRDGLGAGRGRRGAVLRSQHPASLRAGSQPLDRRRSQADLVQVLLHPQAVPGARGPRHGLPAGRLRHRRRGVRGPDPGADRQVAGAAAGDGRRAGRDVLEAIRRVRT